MQPVTGDSGGGNGGGGGGDGGGGGGGGGNGGGEGDDGGGEGDGGDRGGNGSYAAGSYASDNKRCRRVRSRLASASSMVMAASALGNPPCAEAGGIPQESPEQVN